MSSNFTDKTVLITGASSGIGLACAELFAQQGANLILCARRYDRLVAVSEDLQSRFGIIAQPIALDVRDQKSIQTHLGSLQPECRNIDILLNNAGLALGLSSLQEGDTSDWDTMIDINIKGLLYMTRTVLPGMIQRNRGHIINIGSIAGHETYPNGAVYCATKHAVRAINRALKMDLLGTPIRVTSVDPGMVHTEFSLVRFKGDHARSESFYKGLTPLSAYDIAEAILFCASRPPHVNVSELLLLPTDQASVVHVNRQTTDNS